LLAWWLEKFEQLESLSHKSEEEKEKFSSTRFSFSLPEKHSIKRRVLVPFRSQQTARRVIIASTILSTNKLAQEFHRRR